jgi:hypothetical protein
MEDDLQAARFLWVLLHHSALKKSGNFIVTPTISNHHLAV